jgi:transcriptional regulator with XRE-family HTH domain
MIRALLKSYMRQHGYSYREMGKRTGVEYSALNRFVNGATLDSTNYHKIIRWVLA